MKWTRSMWSRCVVIGSCYVSSTDLMSIDTTCLMARGKIGWRCRFLMLVFSALSTPCFYLLFKYFFNEINQNAKYEYFLISKTKTLKTTQFVIFYWRWRFCSNFVIVSGQTLVFYIPSMTLTLCVTQKTFKKSSKIK